MAKIEDFVGRCSPAEMPELIEAAWEAMTEDQKRQFLGEHRDELATLEDD